MGECFCSTTSVINKLCLHLAFLIDKANAVCLYQGCVSRWKLHIIKYIIFCFIVCFTLRPVVQSSYSMFLQLFQCIHKFLIYCSDCNQSLLVPKYMHMHRWRYISKPLLKSQFVCKTSFFHQLYSELTFWVSKALLSKSSMKLSFRTLFIPYLKYSLKPLQRTCFEDFWTVPC
jgi:hypothetical protein